jgi:tetratricopeptide (TPR) repeat protein
MVLTADSTDPLSGTEGRPIADIEGLMAELDRRAAEFGPYHPETVVAAHQLAVAFWCAGDPKRAIGILKQALRCFQPSAYPNHPIHLDLLGTFAEILVKQGQLDRAAAVYREAVGLAIRSSSANHPNSLAAKGDLSLVLFQLGKIEEAACLEAEAYVSAQEYLGRNHAVTCVLAWNRALRLEAAGDIAGANAVMASELTWLLTRSEESIEPDQRMIRAMLARRLQGDVGLAS